ncbi:HNH endonuclease [Devosia sp. 2618]|uniref:HNH endonuclease n=1 Tax=Devosia sp. 2618 TaxID=3156454 RepID=UPI003397DF16
MDLALEAIDSRVLLYAPRDEVKHGYFGTAEVVQVKRDKHDPRFLVLSLSDVVPFRVPISPAWLREIELNDSSQSDEGEFYRYAEGIRRLHPHTFDRIVAWGTNGSAPPEQGVADQAQTEAFGETVEERERRLRSELVRSRRLRFDVIELYGPKCACSSLIVGASDGSEHEVEVCHFMPVKLGGPDNVENAFPLTRTLHFAYDRGLFTVRPSRKILFSSEATSDLKWLFRGNTHARFPADGSARPKTEYLDFHFREIFRGR